MTNLCPFCGENCSCEDRENGFRELIRWKEAPCKYTTREPIGAYYTHIEIWARFIFKGTPFFIIFDAEEFKKSWSFVLFSYRDISHNEKECDENLFYQKNTQNGSFLYRPNERTVEIHLYFYGYIIVIKLCNETKKILSVATCHKSNVTEFLGIDDPFK